MKKQFTFFSNLAAALLVMVFAVYSLGVNAQTIKFTDNIAKQGYSLTQSDANNVRLTYSVTEFTLADAMINGEAMQDVQLPGVFLPTDEGYPNVPSDAKYIAIPQGSTPVLKILNQRTTVYHNVNVAPSPRIPLDSDTGPLHFEKNPQVYNENAFYPSSPVKISEITQIRGVDVILLGITPFQYNPVTKDLVVYQDLEVEVEFQGGNGTFGDVSYRSRFWDPILSDALYNFSSLPEVDYAKQIEQMNAPSETEVYEYIIITPTGQDFQNWADTIRKFRTEQGIKTGVFTLTDVGGNTTSAIEAFINNAYNTWNPKPAACLLLGDFGTDATKNVISPIWDNYCASDNIYADVTGNSMPDVVFSRITANNNDQLTVMVTKFLNYERNPPTNPNFYNKPITALGWQTERWFQICSETVGGFFKNVQGKDPVRINEIYSGTPGTIWSTATNTNTVVNYFGPNGQGYIPSAPNTLGAWSGGTATMINNAINSGCFLLQHRDHGMETGWGEPSYTNGHINNLNNADLTFVMSINCLTGKYNWGGECFTEKFHRHTKLGQNAGALGLIAASETSYSFVNDCYVWGVYDNWWPEFMPTYGSTPLPRGTLPSFGNAAGKYFLQQSSWPYNTSNKPVTYALFHHHGESFSVIYSELPQVLTVTHDPEINLTSSTFSITATEGASVALTVDGTIVGVQTATSAPLVFNLPTNMVLGQNFVVTATKQNFRRYRSIVPVISDVLTAQFSASATQGCETLAVDFTDLSSGTPTSWEWTFEGANPASSTSQNPTGIVYGAEGSYTVTLKVGDGTDFHTTTMTNYISVNNYPAAPISNDTASCVGQAVPDLVASGENVKWYSDANLTTLAGTGNTFTTGLTSAGTYKYYVTQSAGICQSEPTEVTLVISNFPMVSVTAFEPVCANTEAFEPGNATPTGGIWTGTGITNNVFDPATAGVGSHELTYTYTNQYGCTNYAVASVMVNDLPAVSLASFGEICENGTPVTLSGGSPEGGVYSGAGVDNGIFNPSLSGAGEIPVGYTVVDATTTCTNTATSNYMVNPVPVVAFPTDTTVCHNHTVELNATFPNSTYLWSTGSAEAIIVIDTTGVGLSGYKTISVDVTTSKGCTKNSEIVITFTDCTGIGELTNVIGMNVYPNPSNGQFTLELNSAVDMNVNLRLVNVFGTTLWKAEKVTVNGNYITRLNLNTLSDGVYFVILENNGSSVSRKLIIKK